MTPPKQQYQDLGEKDVIQAGDEYWDGNWNTVPKWAVCDTPARAYRFTKFRRPIPASSEEKADNNFGQCGVEGHAACGLAKPMQVGTPEMVSQHNEMRNVASPDHQQAPVGLHGEVASKQVSSPATVHSIQPTAASEEGERPCGYCGNMVSDWADPDWAKGRICKDCYTLNCPDADELRESLIAIRNQRDALTRQNEELKRENEKLSAVLQMANNNTRRRDNKIQSLRAELEQARGENALFKSEVELHRNGEFDDSWHEQCKENERLEKENDSLRSQLAEKNAELEMARDCKSTCGECVTCLQSSLMQEAASKKSWQDEVRHIQSKLDAAEKKLESSSEAYDALVKEHDAAIDERDAATDELKKVREALEWKPIESAPKDGTRILLWSAGAADVGYWSTSFWVTRPEGSPLGKQDGAWIVYESRSDTVELAPSYWCQLPRPPAQSALNKQEGK